MVVRIARRLMNARRPQFIYRASWLFKRPEPPGALHRALFFTSCNTPWLWLIQIVGFCRWIGFGAWRSSYRFSRVSTVKQLEQYGLTRLQLFGELLRFGLLYSIAPHQYARHQLYRPDIKKCLFHFIYDHQLPYFHHYLHRHVSGYRASVALIADKHRFAQTLQKKGIPTVQSQIFDTCELKNDMTLLFQQKTIFCKPNQGSQSKDAFLLRYYELEDRYRLEPIHGEYLHERHDIERYLTYTLARHKQLILQPFVQDHDELKSELSNRAMTTVRIITAWQETSASPVVLYLQLEIPSLRKTTARQKEKQFYTILPLHWETLDVDPVFQKKFPEIKDNMRFIPGTLKNMLREIQSHCIKAHQSLLNLKSVAFDVCLSQQGPVILEANFNWSITLLYQVIDCDPLAVDNVHPAAMWLKQLSGV